MSPGRALWVWRVLAIANGLLAVWNAAGSVRLAGDGRWGWAGFTTVAAAGSGYAAARCIQLARHEMRRNSRGHRDTDRDHRGVGAGQGAGPGTGRGPGPYTHTTITFGSGAAVAGSRPGLTTHVGVTVNAAAVVHGLRALQERLEAQKPRPLPVRQAAEPIVAWKRATLVMDVSPGKVPTPALMAPYAGVRYDIESTAVHLGPGHQLGGWGFPRPVDVRPVPAHEAPDPWCKCGFYACATAEDERLWDSLYESATATLEVELFGRVIAHQSGWRAARQRILSVRVDDACAEPEPVDLDDVAAGVTLALQYAWRSSVRCGGQAVALATRTLRVPRTPEQIHAVELVPVCEAHLAANPVRFTLAQIAGQLGTEVRWGSRPHSDRQEGAA